MTPSTGLRWTSAIALAVLVGTGGGVGCARETGPASPIGQAASKATASTTPRASAPDGSAIARLGDAATNPACALAAPAEIVQAVGGGTVQDLLGVTSPGGYSAALWSCTWHFASTDINLPAVVVMYERTDTVRNEVIAYDRSLIAQQYGSGVTGLGDVAVLHPNDVDIVDGKILMKVRVLLHNTGAEDDEVLAVARLVLPRVKP